MDEEDTSRLVPESAANLWKIVREKTDLQRFGSGIKITCICLALVIIFSLTHGITCILSGCINDKRFIFAIKQQQDVKCAILGFECL